MKSRRRYALLRVALSILVLPALMSRVGVAMEQTKGKAIYMKQCASCHGTSGEGTKEHPDPLIGDRPLVGLIKFIDRDMPEESPEDCAGEDAELVAQYIFDTFYSPIAQARHSKARVELSRLTARQHANVVADLFGSFTQGYRWDDERGLMAEFFNGRYGPDGKAILTRRDDGVRFYGKVNDVKNLVKEEYAARWSGGLMAPVTGDYEFTLVAKSGARVWINNDRTPAIDAWVRSGEQTRETITMRLLGGRVYPLKVEIQRAKKDKAASVELRWKPPHRADEIIPRRQLTPHRQPETFVISTRFPPDDTSRGYERGSLISKQWDRATTDVALKAAAYVEQHLERMAGYRGAAKDHANKVRAFCETFARRAIRRHLTDKERQFFVDRQFDSAGDPVIAAKRSVLLALKSPRFLYHGFESGDSSGYEIASRLSFALLDSVPDVALLKAAAEGRLKSRAQVESQARRMVADLRARSKMRAFFHRWLELERTVDVAKDQNAYPGFNESVLSDLRVSLDMFVDDVVWSDASDYRRLLTDPSMYVNGRLAKYYGIPLDAQADFQRVELKNQARSGVLSHPLLMAGFAYTSSTSPIHRGVFIVRHLLGRTLRPPQEAIVPVDPKLHPKMTTRELVAMQTRAKACQSCHRMINPLGFSLENFDAVGRFRTEEKGKPVDASSELEDLSGEVRKFSGAQELAALLIDSREAHMAFVDQLFRYMIKQPIRAYGHETRERLRSSFVESGYNIRELVLNIAVTSALHSENK
ncbi:MAG: DUF1592 domain-containing protein [Pirellulales bacterium]|nr:DUF1592 domain-containing protein [Pirellulales bacterium]